MWTKSRAAFAAAEAQTPQVIEMIGFLNHNMYDFFTERVPEEKTCLDKLKSCFCCRRSTDNTG